MIGTIIVGFIVGLLARALHPGDDNIGWIWTIILGILGSFVGGWVGQAAGWYQPGQPAGDSVYFGGHRLAVFVLQSPWHQNGQEIS